MTFTATLHKMPGSAGCFASRALALLCGTALVTHSVQDSLAETVVVQNGQTVNVTVDLTQDGDSVVVHAGGAIDVPGGGDSGVSFNSGGADATFYIENAGTLAGGGIGVYVAGSSDIGHLENAAGAVLSGGTYGIILTNGDILGLTNAGLIESANNRAIDSVGNIYNLANLESGVINGENEAIFVGGGADIVELSNAGMIHSNTTNAIVLRNGGDILGLTNLGTGRIEGDANSILVRDGGNVIDSSNAGYIGGLAGNGISIIDGGSLTGFTNFAGGEINGDQSGIQILDGGHLTDLINEGTIEGHVFGIYAWDIGGTGSIDRLVNSGTIRGIASNTITTNHLSNFTNMAGGIVASDGLVAIAVDGGASPFSATNFVNAGTISALGVGGEAIDIDSGGLENFQNLASGTIEGGDRAISVGGDVDGFLNAGTIQAGEITILIAGNTSDFVNSGTISTTGPLALFGIYNTDGVLQFTNSGTVEASNTAGGFYGTIYAWEIGSLTNSGSILAPLDLGNLTNSDHAIWEDDDAVGGTGGDTVLTLLPGSVIRGQIDIQDADPNHDTLVVGSGLNLATTFADVGSVDEIVAPGALVTRTEVGAGYGDLIVVADTSSLGAEDNALSDTTEAISGVLSGELDKDLAPPARNVWAKGFGSVGRTRGGTGAPMNIRFGGLMTGADAMLGETRLGLFGGVAAGTVGAAVANGQAIDTRSYFGGAYGRYDVGSYHVDFALTGGVLENGSERVVANNFVQSGLETATASYNSYFLAPEITIGNDMRFGRYGLKPNATLRYSFLRSSGYTEAGLANGNLEVGARTSHVLDARVQVEMPVETAMRDTKLAFRAGVDGHFLLAGGAFDAIQMGETFADFVAAGDRMSTGAFAGFDFSRALNETAQLFASAEFGTGTETVVRANAEIGVKVGF